MNIIQYDSKYNDKINQFICSILVEEFEYECHREEILNEDNNKYIEKDGNFWLALDEQDNIIGTICIYKNKDEIWELKKLYVAAKYRKTGLAHTLYERLIQFAKEKEITKIQLSTYRKLQVAIRFYLKKGFEIVHNEKVEEDVIFFALDNI